MVKKNSPPSLLKTFMHTVIRFHHFLLILFSMQLSSEKNKLFQSNGKRMQMRKKGIKKGKKLCQVLDWLGCNIHLDAKSNSHRR